MSRRLRIEEIKLQQLKEEEEEEETRIQIQTRRIYSPLVWKRTAKGFRIEDLKEKYFNEAIEIFKEHYIPNEVLCKNTELKEDPPSVESYVKRLLFHMKDMCSIIAVDENYKEEADENEEIEKPKKKKKVEEKIKIAGVLVMRVMPKPEYGRVFSRVQLFEGEAMKKCVNLRSHITRKVDIYEKYNCESVLRYYDLCILPEYRKKGLGLEMLQCGLDVARTMGVPVVVGLFTNFSVQKSAKKLGMQVFYEVNYVDWRDADGEMIFDDPGAGNYTCAYMAGLVPPPPPKPPIKIVLEEPKVRTKTTRAEKRAALAKLSNK